MYFVYLVPIIPLHAEMRPPHHRRPTLLQLFRMFARFRILLELRCGAIAPAMQALHRRAHDALIHQRMSCNGFKEMKPRLPYQAARF